MAKKKNAKKKAARTPRHQKKQKAGKIPPSQAHVKQETFELYFGGKAEPHPHFSQERMAPEEEIISLPKPEALRTIEHKKRIPHVVTAVLAGALLAMFSLFVFYAILLAGDLLSFSLSAAIFVGFSIFLYNRLEKG